MKKEELALLKAVADHLVSLHQRQQFEGNSDTLDVVIAARDAVEVIK